MKKVLITGATGLIGQQLVKELRRKNYAINYLTTREVRPNDDPNYQGFHWNPELGEINVECFKDVSYIINLAGAPIAQRWTASNKKIIMDSRTNSVRLLYDSIKQNGLKIEHFISASAIGYYPYSETRLYDEEYTSTMDSFIVNVVREWEASADNFKQLNIPVAKIRIGMVLSDKGGVLSQLVKPIKSYVGAVLGSGNQWQSWIHIEDLAGIFIYLLEHHKDGVYNGVAPNPVTHKAMTKEIARILNKPLWLPKVPTGFLRLVLGKMHVLVTKGQRVNSKKIESIGYEFKYFQLRNALENLLK
ncbi:MAG: TIGR01777 family oxidoreductase [Bacteroidia bacterium]|nr:TIGR01777 family oxidoreductase [Bacteroidia bacterium]MBT8279605.1 TIGR01777 family oxidoreductase [Bacteroidia bacterium]NNL34026.1 TIGR01777 family protein [Flavobacteriaceae bacterium]RZW43794.1 MAG: TIGR01777 family protein [Flavobacteriaceae bacterium]